MVTSSSRLSWAGARQRRRRSNYMSVKQENPAGLVGPSGSAGPPRLALLRRHPRTLLHRLAIITAVDCVPALLASSAFVNLKRPASRVPQESTPYENQQVAVDLIRGRLDGRHLEADVRQPTARSREA